MYATAAKAVPPASTLTTPVTSDGASPLPSGGSYGTNPLLQDPELQRLLHELEFVTTRYEYTQWKTSFLERYTLYLQQDDVDDGTTTKKKSPTKAAEQTYRHFCQLLFPLVALLQRLRKHFVNGHITTSTCTVKARQCLAHLQQQVTTVTHYLSVLLPTTQDEANCMGFSKFHMGAILLRDGFAEYTRLQLAEQIFDHLRSTPAIVQQVDKQFISNLELFSRQLQIFCDILSDLGLQQPIEKHREFVLAEKDDEDIMTVVEDDEVVVEDDDDEPDVLSPTKETNLVQKEAKSIKDSLDDKPVIKDTGKETKEAAVTNDDVVMESKSPVSSHHDDSENEDSDYDTIAHPEKRPHDTSKEMAFKNYKSYYHGDPSSWRIAGKIKNNKTTSERVLPGSIEPKRKEYKDAAEQEFPSSPIRSPGKLKKKAIHAAPPLPLGCPTMSLRGSEHEVVDRSVLQRPTKGKNDSAKQPQSPRKSPSKKSGKKKVSHKTAKPIESSQQSLTREPQPYSMAPSSPHQIISEAKTPAEREPLPYTFVPESGLSTGREPQPYAYAAKSDNLDEVPSAYHEREPQPYSSSSAHYHDEDQRPTMPPSIVDRESQPYSFVSNTKDSSDTKDYSCPSEGSEVQPHVYAIGYREPQPYGYVSEHLEAESLVDPTEHSPVAASESPFRRVKSKSPIKKKSESGIIKGIKTQEPRKHQTSPVKRRETKDTSETATYSPEETTDTGFPDAPGLDNEDGEMRIYGSDTRNPMASPTSASEFPVVMTSPLPGSTDSKCTEYVQAAGIGFPAPPNRPARKLPVPEKPLEPNKELRRPVSHVQEDAPSSPVKKSFSKLLRSPMKRKSKFSRLGSEEGSKQEMPQLNFDLQDEPQGETRRAERSLNDEAGKDDRDFWFF